MAETSAGGWVRRAVTGVAVMRPQASARAAISAGVGCSVARMRSRASSTEIIAPLLIHPGQFEQIVVGHRAAAFLHFVDHLHQPAGDPAVDAVKGADVGDGSDLDIYLGAALADGKVAPDAGMCLRAGAVE